MLLSRKHGVGLAACTLLLFCAISSVNSYSKYGRGCADIGCLPSEECVISSDSCSYSQREGKECGSYPTCKRKSSSDSSVNPSGSSLKPGPENTIFSPASSSNPAQNTHAYHNNGGASSAAGSTNPYNAATGNNQNGYTHNTHNTNGVGQALNGGNTNNNNANNPHNGRLNPAIIDPHYVFGAPQSIPILPNLPIFPFNAPTQAPSFQQFPQPNHPGSGLSPGFPHGLQPVNPYNPSYVFGQQPYYNGPTGTGGPPAGMGILGGSGGGLAPHSINYGGGGGGYQNPNMYNKPPPQYQNQNPYNRQTQTRPSSAAMHLGSGGVLAFASVLFALLMHQFALSRRST